MASLRSNFFTIVILAIFTFILLDVHKNDTFEKTITAKYLNKIGATPYLNRSLNTIKQSKLYKQYLLPYWNSLLRTVRPYTNSAYAQANKHFNQASIFIQKHTTTLVEYIDGKLLPALKEYLTKLWTILRTSFNRVYSVILETTLIGTDWMGKNVFAKLPQEQIQKAFTTFVASTQKVALNTYDWISDHIQKLIV